jgi:glycosyltransferase A (GT-A) superfamily protein (DUF2064 family)
LTDARDRAAAVVVARAPRPGLCKTGLEPLLGAEGCARLQVVLIRRAVAWAAAVGTPYVAFAPGDARADFEALVPAGTRLLEQAGKGPGDRLAAATGEVHAEHGGPVLVVGVDTPQLRPEVGRRALEDLREGCDATVGPTNAGGYYLVGLREPRPEIFDVPGEAWSGPELFGRTLEAAHRAGLSLGMLRAERELDDEGDARALLADPLAPADIVEVLRAATAC